MPLNTAPTAHAVHDVADSAHCTQFALQGWHTTPCPGSVSNWPAGHTHWVPESTEGGVHAVQVVDAVRQAAHCPAQLLHTTAAGLGSLS